MEIKTTFKNRAGDVLPVFYQDIENISQIGDKKIHSVHAFCFCDGKMVIVYSDKKGVWSPPGGGVELGEGIEDAVVREVKEETNMKVIKHQFFGLQDVTQTDGVVSQTRSVCIVEPYGDFVSDPDGDITKIELINPLEYKKYFDWGDLGDYVIKRAIGIYEKMQIE